MSEVRRGGRSSGPHGIVRLAAACGSGVVLVLATTGCGHADSGWALPNHDPSSTRHATGTGITTQNVSSLRLLWRFPIRARTESGAITATPLIAKGVVYVQDMKSDVVAVAAGTGRKLWRHSFGATSPGPNGLALADGRLFGATDSTAFALSATDGETLWTRRLVTATARYVDVAPQVADGLVFLSSIGLPPDGQGVLYALNAASGRVVWRRNTIKGRFAVPAEAGGGGAWYPPSVSASTAYWGIANPYPYGGSRTHPNGGAYAGNALYTDSLLATNTHTGAVEWYDQVTPHDVRDFDFAVPPILSNVSGRDLIVGAGKAGLVVAWDAKTHKRLWKRRVGLHVNDTGPLPDHLTRVCPGLFGGVETPMAILDDTVFVPVVNLCAYGSSHGYRPLAGLDPRTGTGELVALDARSGAVRWITRLRQPDFGCATAAGGVVFTSTFAGDAFGFDARTGAALWHARLPAGINSCPAVAHHLLVIGAGVGKTPVLEAFGF
jgi:outer membrane protein assembly factor BamB